ncbi:MAG: LrgB family protein [Lawsonibacter sp.]|nr:LrgB family protein [Lawsonibacter sp.]
MDAILSSPLFGLTLTCGAWALAQWFQKKSGFTLLPPILVAVALILTFLLAFRIPYACYEAGGSIIHLMLTPVTAVLALNIYNQRKLLGRYFLPVVAGCLAGSLTSVVSVVLLCRLLAVDSMITASILPKSVTTAIAVAIADSQGGLPSLAVAAVMVAGIGGTVCAPLFARLFRITDPVAEGVAIGACSHALGTTKAMEIGELQGAMSSIAICICGILTAVLVLFL